MTWSTMHFFVVIVVAVIYTASTSQSNSRPARSHFSPKVGPVFPITASFFKDRFSKEEWNHTLVQFKQQGGDTVLLRAPPIVKRSIDDLRQDPSFRFCGSYKSSTGTGLPACYDEATQELTEMGLKIKAFATYQYEEDFSDAIMLCPKYDRKILSSRKYFRIVLPAGIDTNSKSQCNVEPGSEVVVLFTSFSGIDPHQLLLETASVLNISVYFSLPGIPIGFDPDLIVAYYQWVDRVLLDHTLRYGNSKVDNNMMEIRYQPRNIFHYNVYTNQIHSHHNMPVKKDTARQSVSTENSLYDSLAGYSTAEKLCIVDSSYMKEYLQMYEANGYRVKRITGKRFLVSLSIDLNKYSIGASLAQHVQGFVDIAHIRVVDIMMVSEGRGVGRGSYYWPHQLNQTINSLDPVLDSIIHYKNTSIKPNVTYAEVFSASNRDLFLALQEAKNRLQLNQTNVEFWLCLQAFEYLIDDPCLPVDQMSSALGETLNRASKSRVLQALRVASARVQKVVTAYWDPDFTCTTNKQNKSLHDEIMTSLKSTLVANCSFHTPRNLSVVLLGFNLASYYTVDWVDTRNRTHSDSVYAYYFEMDYGLRHHLVDSLEYTMLYGIPAMVTSLAPSGTIKVTPQGQTESCFYQYDLPYK